MAIGDDRDLGRLPAAAQGLDAVRLMTIHGAKGLDLPVRPPPGPQPGHAPKSVKGARMPTAGGRHRGIDRRCEDGVARWGRGGAGVPILRRAVARARPTRHVCGHFQEKANHSARPLSEFLDRLGAGVARSTPDLLRKLPPAPEDEPVTLVIDGTIRLRDSQVAMLDKGQVQETLLLHTRARHRGAPDRDRLHEDARGGSVRRPRGGAGGARPVG
ncbi:hypothetical protein AB5I41_09750 [Sphingomonas sp. MMS24-JH45]